MNKVWDVSRPKRAKPEFDTIEIEKVVIQEFDERVIIGELYRRKISTDHIFGAYYALEQQAYHRDDEMFGSSEEGQHGK